MVQLTDMSEEGLITALVKNPTRSFYVLDEFSLMIKAFGGSYSKSGEGSTAILLSAHDSVRA